MSELIKHYIDNQPDFEQACSLMNNSSILALDTEFERRNTYYPILALLQVASSEDSFLIDPLKITDWKCFTDLFIGERIFVMHSCSEDLEVFRKHMGSLPRNLMDTQIACAFVGKGDALGYANMVNLFREIEIDKSETRSNWLQRPLTASQQDYAREDVRWLLGIYTELRAELAEKGRLDWVKEECRILVQRYQEETPIEKQWLRIKGLARIKKDSRVLAFALADWREQLCRSLDKPRGWIMKDSELLEIAQSRPKNKRELSTISGVTPSTINRNSQAILEITNSSDLPVPSTQPLPEIDQQEKAILKRCQKLVNDQAESLSIAARFIGNKQDLIEFIVKYSLSDNKATFDETAFTSGWRKEMVGEGLLDIVKGSV